MNYSQYRRAQNEAVFKQHNQEIKRLVKGVLAPADPDLALRFSCECSDETCRDTIEIPVREYDRVSRSAHQFVVLPGHEQPDIERVVAHKGYNVVEKFAAPSPPADGKLNPT